MSNAEEAQSDDGEEIPPMTAEEYYEACKQLNIQTEELFTMMKRASDHGVTQESAKKLRLALCDFQGTVESLQQNINPLPQTVFDALLELYGTIPDPNGMIACLYEYIQELPEKCLFHWELKPPKGAFWKARNGVGFASSFTLGTHRRLIQNEKCSRCIELPEADCFFVIGGDAKCTSCRRSRLRCLPLPRRANELYPPENQAVAATPATPPRIAIGQGKHTVPHSRPSSRSTRSHTAALSRDSPHSPSPPVTLPRNRKRKAEKEATCPHQTSPITPRHAVELPAELPRVSSRKKHKANSPPCPTPPIAPVHRAISPPVTPPSHSDSPSVGLIAQGAGASLAMHSGSWTIPPEMMEPRAAQHLGLGDQSPRFFQHFNLAASFHGMHRALEDLRSELEKMQHERAIAITQAHHRQALVDGSTRAANDALYSLRDALLEAEPETIAIVPSCLQNLKTLSTDLAALFNEGDQDEEYHRMHFENRIRIDDEELAKALNLISNLAQ